MSLSKLDVEVSLTVPNWYVFFHWFLGKYHIFFFLREKNIDFVVSLTDEFIGWFSHVPWPRIEPAALECLDNAPPNRAIQPGPIPHVLLYHNHASFDFTTAFKVFLALYTRHSFKNPSIKKTYWDFGWDHIEIVD